MTVRGHARHFRERITALGSARSPLELIERIRTWPGIRGCCFWLRIVSGEGAASLVSAPHGYPFPAGLGGSQRERAAERVSPEVDASRPDMILTRRR